MLTFKCHNCSIVLEIADDLAGEQVSCPECDTVMIVPTPTAKDLQDLEVLKSSIGGKSTILSRSIIDYMIDNEMTIVELDGDSDDRQVPVDQLKLDRKQNYEIKGMIGRGGMGIVLDAKDLNLRRHVAMKVMSKEDAEREKIVRFIDEAAVTAQLEHPNIIPVHELGVDESGNAFYTMKYVRGFTLDHVIKQLVNSRTKAIDQYPLHRLLTIFLKICDAIAFAHSKGVVHRDLKPENIMIGNYAEVLVLDWGISKVLGDDEASTADSSAPAWSINDIESMRLDSGTLMTLDGVAVGTPGFMAPEQCLGQADEIDELTDVYQLGGVLYNILTLNDPVKGKTVNDVLVRTTQGKIEDPLSYDLKGNLPSPTIRKKSSRTYLEHCPNFKVPDALAAVAMKALSVEKADRYQSVLELQQDIESYLNGFATGAESASPLRQAVLMINRKKGVFLSAVATLVVLITALVIFAVNLKEKAAEADEDFEESRLSTLQIEAERKNRKILLERALPSVMRRIHGALKKAEWKTAQKELSRGLRIDNRKADLHCMQGMLYLAQKKFENAISSFEKVQELDPENLSVKVEPLLKLSLDCIERGTVDDVKLTEDLKSLPEVLGLRILPVDEKLE
ncbi:protein kinase [bacterium AH-315-E10]|nr:protein kinase [bacterium AH-315-E10]